MTQKNTVLSVAELSRKMGITPTADKGGSVAGVVTFSVGAILIIANTVD